VQGEDAATATHLEDAMGHLLNHASLHADECLEPQLPAYDIFSIAAQVLSTGAVHWPGRTLAGFQAYPTTRSTRSASIGRPSRTAYYSFGSALFAGLSRREIRRRRRQVLPAIWRRGAQNGHIVTFEGEARTGDVKNNPDFFAAIDLSLQQRGASFDKAFEEFLVWRYLLGANDDGAAFPQGQLVEGRRGLDRGQS